MIEINEAAWQVMLDHARDTYPNECCGMLTGTGTQVTAAIPCKNIYQGDQSDRFEIDPHDILRVQRESIQQGQELIGFFHSHPDEDAYFSATDLKNASPWHAHVVLSIRQREFRNAKAFRVDLDLTESTEEELLWPKS